MTDHRFDVVILGGGSGGYAAALRSAELGRSVALIERDKVGGTCLHRGCIPTKAMLHAAEIADTVRTAQSYGIDAAFGGVDAAAVATYRDGIVAKKYKGLTGLIAARSITVVSGTGTLEAKKTIRVGEDRYIGGDVVIATGAAPKLLPGIALSDRILTSDQALALAALPERVVVLGGGVIGVEFASLWASFGVAVTIVEALEHLVPNEDRSVSVGLERAFRRRKIGQRLGVRVREVTERGEAVQVVLEDGTELVADLVLVAVGRAPALEGIGLAAAGVAVSGGWIEVDERLATTAPGIWAVGDVVAGPQLAHRGFQHGIAVAERIAGLESVPVPDTHVPKITYSHPEAASVGLTESQAQAQFGADAVQSTEFNLAGNAKSEILGTGGFVKVVRQVDGPVLGVHLLGDRVGELITEGQLAVAWEAFPEDLAALLHAHPTQSEALGEAFLTFAGKPLHSL